MWFTTKLVADPDPLNMAHAVILGINRLDYISMPGYDFRGRFTSPDSGNAGAIRAGPVTWNVRLRQQQRRESGRISR